MTDRPIIFSAPMVRALLDGRKTQTRRLLKPRKGLRLDEVISKGIREGNQITCTREMLAPEPYAPGDRLYVREAHALVGTVDPGWLLYRADGYESECIRHGFSRPFPPESDVRWRPSIHMPRWASRLTLTVTDVRVHRLQDISEADAVAEGIEADEFGAWHCYQSEPKGQTFWACPRESFRTLWNSLHGPDAWNANPWVVAISFTVQRGNIDQIGGAA